MEERLNELEKRISKLEKIEKRRKTFALVKFIIVIALIGVVAYGGYVLYQKVEETIKPYKKIVEQYNKADEKINSIKDLFK